MKSFYEMLPGEIIKSRKLSSCAFIPVSPIEWHSYHLPIGTDALISERISRLMAEKVNGIYFKPMNLGIDEERQKEKLLKWGFREDDKVFGMNFPELPLVSEYCSIDDLKLNMKRRINFVKKCNFKFIFIVNHHGGRCDGKNQNEYLKELCEELTSADSIVELANSYRFMTLEDKELNIEYGGHAGISETTFLTAFRSDLVDLSKIPEGELNVRKTGIPNYKPIVEEERNPRNISKALADELRENIINNFFNYINEKYLKI